MSDSVGPIKLGKLVAILFVAACISGAGVLFRGTPFSKARQPGNGPVDMTRFKQQQAPAGQTEPASGPEPEVQAGSVGVTTAEAGALSTGLRDLPTTSEDKVDSMTIAAAVPEVPREFRGVWVATVGRIDWPHQDTTEEQKKSMIDILDLAVEMNMNAVLFQVRPTADALYASDLEPWSRFLTGTEGVAPDPYYDPLAFAVEEAHKRGLELHAWFNPYRAGPIRSREHAAKHISKQHPELVRVKGNSLWMDPGEKGVHEHSLAVILDVVKRYDIDAVHMDEYFYPYGASQSFDDEKTWNAYTSAGGELSREDWRRKNVNDFVSALSRRIKETKPYVKLGLSPLGVWRPGYPEGVGGLDQYNSIFADPRKWLEEGWVDYMAPQLYMPIESKEQPFVPLLIWWTEQNKQGRHVWPGLYTVQYSRDQIRRQVEESRKILGNAAGHIHFSQRTFNSDRGRTFVQTIYQTPALVPEAAWMSGAAPAPGIPMATAGLADAHTLNVVVDAESLTGARLWVVQYLNKGEWGYKIIPSGVVSATIPKADQAYVFSVNRLGKASRKSPVSLP